MLQNEEGCDIYIVGTKREGHTYLVLTVVVDLIQEGSDRGHTPEEVKAYAAKIGAKVFETSAKTGHGINELFQDIAESYCAKATDNTPQHKDTIKPQAEQKTSKKCCGG